MHRKFGSIIAGSLAVAVVEIGALNIAQAEWPWKSRGQKPACGVPATEPDQKCSTPSSPPSAPPEAPQSPPPSAPPGYYQQPVAAPSPAVYQAPQVGGDVSGDSQSVGIRGFRLRFPELNVEMPTLQLPSLVRYRRGSEMQFDSSRSPQIPGMTAVPSQIVPGGVGIPVGYSPGSAPGYAAPPVAAPGIRSIPNSAPGVQSPPSAPPGMPAAPGRCGPGNPACGPDGSPAPAPPDPNEHARRQPQQQYSDPAAESELDATRRELAAYREELAQLRAALRENARVATQLEEPAPSQFEEPNRPAESAESSAAPSSVRRQPPRYPRTKIAPTQDRRPTLATTRKPQTAGLARLND